MARAALPSLAVLVVAGIVQTGHANEQSLGEPATPSAPVASVPAAERDKAAFLFVKGTGILRLQGGGVSPVLSTRAAIRDLQLDSEGALWASLSEVGIVRRSGERTVNLSKESFARLAIRSPIDVWAINDSHGSVVHYDGKRWKTVRTRKSLAGHFDNNHLVDIARVGRSAWVASWNGLWRVTGMRWTPVEPPAGLASAPKEEGDDPEPPAYPLSLVASRRGLLACYMAGCFLRADAAWQSVSWPIGKARLLSAGGEGLAAGPSADGVAIVVAPLDGSGEAATSESLTTHGINDVAIDDSGRVWVAANDTLVVLDGSGRVIRRWPDGTLEGVKGEIQRIVVDGAGPNPLPASQASPVPRSGK